MSQTYVPPPFQSWADVVNVPTVPTSLAVMLPPLSTLTVRLTDPTPPSVPLLAAPLPTVTAPPVPLIAPLTRSVPAVTVVVPAYVLVPPRTRAPGPVLMTFPLPVEL